MILDICSLRLIFRRSIVLDQFAIEILQHSFKYGYVPGGTAVDNIGFLENAKHFGCIAQRLFHLCYIHRQQGFDSCPAIRLTTDMLDPLPCYGKYCPLDRAYNSGICGFIRADKRILQIINFRFAAARQFQAKPFK